MKIRDEQKKLAEEKEELESTLKSKPGSRSSFPARSRPTRRNMATTGARRC
jgi:hypothetical protein